MSGGSYNYLYQKDFQEICEHQSDIKKMVDRLVELGYTDVAKESETILLLIESFKVRLDARLDRLEPVWHAVEWNDSGDSGIENIKDAIKEYRGDNIE